MINIVRCQIVRDKKNAGNGNNIYLPVTGLILKRGPCYLLLRLFSCRPVTIKYKEFECLHMDAGIT